MVLLMTDLAKFMVTPDDIEQKEKGYFVSASNLQECAICLGVPNHPETLPCGHNFCTECIDTFRDADPANSSCPTCRGPISGAAAAGTRKGGRAQPRPRQTMYEYLHMKRAVFLDQFSATRREAVGCAKALHEESRNFQRDLRALAGLSPADRKPGLESKCLKFLTSRNVNSARCRLMCLSDATASMQSVWKRTRDSILTMLERIADVSGGAGNIEARLIIYQASYGGRRTFFCPVSRISCLV